MYEDRYVKFNVRVVIGGFTVHIRMAAGFASYKQFYLYCSWLCKFYCDKCFNVDDLILGLLNIFNKFIVLPEARMNCRHEVVGHFVLPVSFK